MRDPDGIGDWPRRLLHVPSMTSLPWRPGNMYGQFDSPRYNVVSYTWGRFRLDLAREHSNSKQGLPIQGVEWPIPPIDPEHFTEGELDVVLQRMAEAYSVDFVWIDVACIDQRRGSKEGYLEVGRQAAIFRGARQIFIWWTKFTGDRTRALWDRILEGTTYVEESIIRPPSSLSQEELELSFFNFKELDDNITIFLSDPWFSSLWTLQEAFLGSTAQVLCRDGNPLSRGIVHNGFRFITSVFDAVSNDCARALSAHDSILQTFPRLATLCTNIHQAVQQRALPELIHVNKLGLYAAAGRRTASEPLDYIYGIQQIFGYRVGATRVDTDPNQDWTLGDLEEELAREIIADCPVRSQMHVFQQPMSYGKRWHISRSSHVPVPLAGMGHMYTELWECPISSQYTLEVHKFGDIALLRFWGHMCEYTRLHASWMKPVDAHGNEYCYFRVMLDAVSIDDAAKSGEPLEYRTVGHMRDIWRGLEQNKLSAWLANKYNSSQLMVLRLGSREERGQLGTLEPCEIVGLILLRGQSLEGLTYWHRIGFCHWVHGDEFADWQDTKNFLAARDDSPGWVQETGVFG
ncbi:hypothetical protein PG999_001294 [Apiospora kogelbergensis]|uniref:Heterokaryon incompatibility domain-containing protein n=1 Tax=Apiospora kogelbergensis TaxID=1337665 RepID=A0AAW0RE11_9PEZI